MASSQGHSHDDCSDHDHGDDKWVELERIYTEKSTEEESLIEWLTKNVDLYLPSVVASGMTVSNIYYITSGLALICMTQFVKLDHGLLKTVDCCPQFAGLKDSCSRLTASTLAL